MIPTPEAILPHEAPRIAVVVSRYNQSVTSRMLAGAMEAFARAGGRPAALDVFEAPGAFEIVAITAAVLSSGRFDGVVALGCIIKGQTRHDEVLAHAVTGALAELSAHYTAAVGLGVLTVNTPSQARARIAKGAEAMEACLATVRQIRRARGIAGDSEPGLMPARPDKLRAVGQASSRRRTRVARSRGGAER